MFLSVRHKSVQINCSMCSERYSMLFNQTLSINAIQSPQPNLVSTASATKNLDTWLSHAWPGKNPTYERGAFSSPYGPCGQVLGKAKKPKLLACRTHPVGQDCELNDNISHNSSNVKLNAARTPRKAPHFRFSHPNLVNRQLKIASKKLLSARKTARLYCSKALSNNHL
jgi:hypothetical protein